MATVQELTNQILALQEQLTNQYKGLGLRAPSAPTIHTHDAKSLEFQIQWLEKQFQYLTILRQQKKQTRKQQWLNILHQLKPSSFSGRLSQLGVKIPDSQPDAFGADAAFYAQLKPFIRYLFEDYWRVEVEGIQNIPNQGAALMVSNHAGLLPFDALMVRYAIETYHPTARQPRYLLEDWFMKLPGINLFLTRIGALQASQENAQHLLTKQELVGIFPEGSNGVLKPFQKRYRVQRFGRGGAIRLAIKHQVPIIPIAIVGNEETYPILGQPPIPFSKWGLDVLPLTPLFPWLGLFGLLPLPSKWLIGFGAPIEFTTHGPDIIDNDLEINRLNEYVRQEVQEQVNQLLQKRHNAWLG